MAEYRTKTGRVLTDADIEALAREAERGYDVRHLAKVGNAERDSLESFMQAVVERPEDSCSACSDCDYERLAAYNEILRLRAALRRPPRRWWRWGYRA